MNQPKHGVFREGVFNPKNLETLRPEAHQYIGKEFYYLFAWTVREGEGFAGQNAYTMHPKTDRHDFLFWCPEEDITWLTEGDDE